jgi:hypothetical protein
MSAHVMRRREHPPVTPSGELVPDALLGALRLAETVVGHRLTGETNDPADAGTSNRAPESLEVS